jgi:DNA repair exonuclease SbcCD ATPase subunit
VNILTVIKTHRAMATMLFANAGVAVSVLFGAFQFFATYEQTQEQVSFLSGEFDQLVRHHDLDERLMDINVRLDEGVRDLPSQMERLTRLEEQVQGNDVNNDVHMLEAELGALKDRVVFLESQLQQVHSASDTVRLLDDRVDALDDFVVRWDEQSSQIMVEHKQLGDIVEDIYARLDELSGERTRVTLPAGSQRGYGYD